MILLAQDSQDPGKLAYEDMYPPVGIDLLREIRNANQRAVDTIAEDSFGVADILNPLNDRPNAVSISIFFANIDNTYADQFPITDEDRGRWIKKYFRPLMQNVRWFEEGFDTGNWKLIVYVCPNSLNELKPEIDILDELQSFDFAEIRVMAKPSIGHGPGASWRFLAMSEFALDRVLIFDIDEPWNDSINTWHEAAANYGKPFTRAHHMPRPDFWLKPETAWFINHDGSVRNYPPMLSSKLMIEPELFGIPDVDRLMASHIWLRQSRAKSPNPLSQLADDEPLTPYNRPTGRHKCGWGNHWHQYCFDERFLKHVIFPCAAEAGKLCTWCLPQDIAGDLGQYLRENKLDDFLADFRYTQRMSPANIIVNGNRVVTEQL